jgi:hypothetical protein
MMMMMMMILLPLCLSSPIGSDEEFHVCRRRLRHIRTSSMIPR